MKNKTQTLEQEFKETVLSLVDKNTSFTDLRDHLMKTDYGKRGIEKLSLRLYTVLSNLVTNNQLIKENKLYSKS